MAAGSRRRALLAWVTVCIVWGTTYLGIGVALETMPVGLLAGLRWTAAGALLAAAVWARSDRGRGGLPAPREWPKLALGGFLLTVTGNGLVVWAQQHVASGLAAVVIAMVPFWAVCVDAMLPRGERLSPRILSGLALGFTGIVVLVWPEIEGVGGRGPSFLFGIGALQVACIGWAFGTWLNKHAPAHGSQLGSAALQMLFGGLMLLAAATATGEWEQMAVNARTLTAMLHLILIGSILGYSCYLYALQHLPVSTVSLYAYINPIIAVLLGTLILGEPLDRRIVITAALVLAGSLVVRWATPAPASTSPRVGDARRAAA